MKRLLLALFLALGITPAFGQAPPPVPALPDTQRLTTYTITGTTCACAVGFQIYGDGTDYQNWVEVWLNGVNVSNTSPTAGWTLTSPSGPLASITRPITDAVITFNSVQTGTVQILGARRPRRVSQFSESAGVPARSLNQVFTDLTAQNRETWDKLNDVTGRSLLTPPGNAMGPLPNPANCAGQVLSFGINGLTPTCIAVATSGAIVASVRSTAAATVTASATSDYFFCLDPTSNAITLNLPASPPTGLSYLVKDCTGHSQAHNITITPAAGTIDGAATFILSTNFQSTAITYTGAQWSLN